jgi:hypothetical protein
VVLLLHGGSVHPAHASLIVHDVNKFVMMPLGFREVIEQSCQGQA